MAAQTSQIIIEKVYIVNDRNTAGNAKDIVITSQNQILLVGIAVQNGTLSAPSFDGVLLTQIVTGTDAKPDNIAWYLHTSPPVGQKTLNIPAQGAQSATIALVISGASKVSTNYVTVASAGVTGNAITTAITAPVANSLLVDLLMSSTSKFVIPAADQTLLMSQDVVPSFFGTGGASYKISTGSQDIMSWTMTGNDANAQVIVAIPPATAPSLWFPNVDLRNVNDVVGSNNLSTNFVNAVPAADTWNNYGNYAANFYQNSFLHTVGRMIGPPPPNPAPATKFTISTITDSFHRTDLNTQWTLFTAGGASVEYTAGGLKLLFAAASTSSTDADITSNDSYDLTGNSIYLHVLSVSSIATAADNTLSIYQDVNNKLQFQVEQGVLYAIQIVAGAQTNLYSQQYSAINHGWWRIRESSGTIFWETSIDGKNWVNFTQTPNPIPITGMKVNIEATCFEVETNPGAFSFENLNVPPSDIFDVFQFNLPQRNYDSSSFLQTVGRIINPPPVSTISSETEQETSQIIIDKVFQGQVASQAASTVNLVMDISIPSQDAVLIVTGGSVIATGAPWASVQFNGNLLTKLVQAGVANNSAEIWWMPNPPVGTYPLAIASGTGGEIYANAMVLLGVDKTNTNVITASATDAASTATIAAQITPDSANSLIIDTLASFDATAVPIPDTSQTQVFNATALATSEQVLSTFKLSNPAPQNMNYNLSVAVNAALVVAAFRPAHAPSQWFPNIDLREIDDTVTVSGLDAGRNPAFGNYGYKASTFWQNSFLHTIGREEPIFKAAATATGSTLLMLRVG